MLPSSISTPNLFQLGLPCSAPGTFALRSSREALTFSLFSLILAPLNRIMKPALRALLAILSFFPAMLLHSQVITTIAGTPTVFGFSGAGGPATSILIREPFNVVVDNGGNIFFTDPLNDRIWKINTAGIASVYAGTGV